MSSTPYLKLQHCYKDFKILAYTRIVWKTDKYIFPEGSHVIIPGFSYLLILGLKEDEIFAAGSI